ncbi:MAG: 30S ribosomal protein S16 [Dehalococcoidales bacterium]
MLKIRLRRMGAPKKPKYRLVVAEARSPRDGHFIDILGHFDPMTDPETLSIDQDKARDWLNKGAQPTDTAARLLEKAGVTQKSNLTKEKS